MDWGETGVRIFAAGIALLACCSGLLGVCLGWWLRGREVQELRTKLEHVREDLKGQARLQAARGGVMLQGQRIDQALRGKWQEPECRVRYFGPNREENGWMLCQRTAGHYTKEGTKHGYGGIFWGEGK